MKHVMHEYFRLREREIKKEQRKRTTERASERARARVEYVYNNNDANVDLQFNLHLVT